MCQMDAAQLPTENNQQPKPNEQGHKDDRRIVTPYAFGIADELLGKKLASPSRRLVALIIDLILILFISSLNALFLAGFSAIAFLRTNIRLAKQKRFRRTRIALSAVIALLVFTVIYGLVDSFNGTEPEEQETAITGEQAIVSGALLAAWYTCDDFDCKKSLTDQFATMHAESTMQLDEIESLLDDFIGSDASLSEEQKSDIIQTALSEIATRRDAQAQAITEVLPEELNSAETSAQNEVAETESQDTPMTSETNEYPGVMNWIEGLAAEFGLGFGWAALYFSALTSMWGGATPGKKICGIYVVRINGKLPTLWESFGRYGGYGAGLATGLSGFFQIYWDPNRQAIQDKISETLVLRRV